MTDALPQVDRAELPKLDRAELRRSLLPLIEQVLDEVADAVDSAPKGHVIRDSEEKARCALDRLREACYQHALQGKIDAAEAAFPPPVSAATGKPKRHKGKQNFSVLTVNGRARLRRVRWHCPEEGSETPVDCLLDQAEATISEGVREMACRLNQHVSSFEKAAANMERAAHLKVSKETLRQLVEGEGKIVQRAMQRAELTPDWSAADCVTQQGTTRLYLGCDGVKVPLVTDEEKKKRRQTIRQKRKLRGRRLRPLPPRRAGADSDYKEFRVGYLYDETKKRRCVGVTSGNHEAAGRMLCRLSTQVQLAKAEEQVALIDGAPWIRNQIEFHGLVNDIGLDFWHLQDNSQKARRVLFGEDSEKGKEWVGELMHTFKHQGCDDACDLLTATRAPLRSPTKRAAINGLMQYVSARQDIIRYPEFREKHWQIGSGPTEAECKTTTQRIKGRGRRWDSSNAEAMMALAALDDSGMWEQHWQNLETKTT